MKIQDILSEEEIEDYHKQWDLFKQYHTRAGEPAIESEYHTHSGIPVISKVFQYKDYPIFRTHVFQERLRKFDPYFIFKTYGHPFWHLEHYIMVCEQTYHTSIRKIKDTNKFATVDTPLEFKLSNPIFWDDMAAVELILELKRRTEKYLIEDCHFNFYNDKTNNSTGRVSFRTFTRPKAYIQDIEKIKQGNEEALEGLIRKIEGQDINQKRLIKPRINLPEKDYLISELKAGRIPEEELHNFFSFWDKP